MKNNLLTTNSEEIAKLYLQPLVSNLNGLTVYGGKRLTEPITIFIKGVGIKLGNYLCELDQSSNTYNPDSLDYINECEFSVYGGRDRNLTINNVDKVTVNNIPIKKVEDSPFWDYPYVFDDSENWYCVLIYGILDEGEENGEHYIWNKLNNIFSSNTSKYDVISIPPQSIIILPKLLEEMPTGKSTKALRLLDGYYSISEAASIIESFEEIYTTELKVISDYGESQGSHLWNCYQYCKQNFNEDTHEPIVYITSDTLPKLYNAYSLNNVKVRFLNPMLALLARTSLYWSNLDIGYNDDEYVKYLLNTYNNADTITVFYNVTSTSGTHLNYIGVNGYSTPSESFTKMYIDGEESEIVTNYTFSTTGIHIVLYKCSSSYTSLTPLFTGVDFYAIILPAQISEVCDFAFAPADASESAFYIGLNNQLVLPSNSFSSRKITLFILLSNSIPGSIFTTNNVEGGGIQNTTTIYVPASAVDTYKTATGWSTYADQIKAIPE